MNENYKNLYGTWLVSTEGDVEGKTTKMLGTFTGWVDEIALHLADQCFYSLEFRKEEPIDEYVPKKESVDVSFSNDSNTWDNIHNEHGLNEMREVFADRPVKIEKGNYYSSFRIVSNKFVDNEIKKQEILNKLTKEEKEILGFK